MSSKERKKKAKRTPFIYLFIACVVVTFCAANFIRKECKDENEQTRNLQQLNLQNHTMVSKFSPSIAREAAVAVNIITEQPRNPGNVLKSFYFISNVYISQIHFLFSYVRPLTEFLKFYIANLIALLHNVASNIPTNWPIQIFTTSRSMPYMIHLTAIKKLVDNKRLVLQQVYKCIRCCVLSRATLLYL